VEELLEKGTAACAEMYKTFVESVTEIKPETKPEIALAPEPEPKPAAKAQPKPPKEKKVRNHDYYFAPTYQLPVTRTTAGCGGLNFESGVIWVNEMFWGIEIGLSHPLRSLSLIKVDARNIGISVNSGVAYNLTNYLKFMFGVSAGAWGLWHSEDTRTPSDERIDIGIIGPFIGLSWHDIEFKYRGWICNRYAEDGIDYNSQLMLGYNFATDKRHR
jgi:hypothetical protein